MAKIRDANTLMSMLAGGELPSDLSEEITGTVAAIEAVRAGRVKAKVTGSVTLEIKLSSSAGGMFIDVELKSKRPKKARESAFFFVDGEDLAIVAEETKLPAFEASPEMAA
jgi:hypothetical protein